MGVDVAAGAGDGAGVVDEAAAVAADDGAAEVMNSEQPHLLQNFAMRDLVTKEQFLQVFPVPEEAEEVVVFVEKEDEPPVDVLLLLLVTHED